MKNKIKYTVLPIGIVLLFFSFLFFGREHGLYTKLLLTGLLISLIGFFLVALGSHRWKVKLLWVFVALTVIPLNLYLRPLLIKTSFLIYISEHKSDLESVNKLLSGMDGDILVFEKSVRDDENVVSQKDKEVLLTLRKKLKLYFIFKINNRIGFCLTGFLDSQVGIFYFLDDTVPDPAFMQLKDRWYY